MFGKHEVQLFTATEQLLQGDVQGVQTLLSAIMEFGHAARQVLL